MSFFLVFFFQAEDGIRDRNVTGVQTCALPILNVSSILALAVPNDAPIFSPKLRLSSVQTSFNSPPRDDTLSLRVSNSLPRNWIRSEERRVGKECRSRVAAEY